MDNTLCYYKPLGKNRPIVERVEACNTKLRYAALDNELYDSAPLEAALTRQAAEDWARGRLDIAMLHAINPRGTESYEAFTKTRDAVLQVLTSPNHERTNAAAHALADLLEQE